MSIDRLWWLDGPIRSGGRRFYHRTELRLGGGGYNTGRVLRRLGHEVILVTRIAMDALGTLAADHVGQLGFATHHVERVDEPTRLTEIFVDPLGERTIIGDAGRRRPPLALPDVAADVAYFNVSSLHPDAHAVLTRIPLVLTQWPLASRQARPADILIGSRSDILDESVERLRERALEISGERWAQLILTDGANDVLVVERQGVATIEIEPGPPVQNTTGAGDFFAAGLIDALLRRAHPTAAVQFASRTVREMLQACAAEPPLVAPDSDRPLSTLVQS